MDTMSAVVALGGRTTGGSSFYVFCPSVFYNNVSKCAMLFKVTVVSAIELSCCGPGAPLLLPELCANGSTLPQSRICVPQRTTAVSSYVWTCLVPSSASATAATPWPRMGSDVQVGVSLIMCAEKGHRSTGRRAAECSMHEAQTVL